LDPSQEVERSILEKMGFRLDGVEFGIEVERLIELLGPTRTTLPHGYQILAMDYGRDIEQVVKLETEVHAADKSSRVNFDNETAVRSMMDYYKKACSGNGVFLLRHGNRLVGLVGFMPDQERENAVHISSVALALPQQGTGLFFPLTLNALEISQYASAKKLTGVTTTKRLLDAAQKYSFEVLGLSLSLSSK
jgi:hypothetical protein